MSRRRGRGGGPGRGSWVRGRSGAPLVVFRWSWNAFVTTLWLAPETRLRPSCVRNACSRAASLWSLVTCIRDFLGSQVHAAMRTRQAFFLSLSLSCFITDNDDCKHNFHLKLHKNSTCTLNTNQLEQFHATYYSFESSESYPPWMDFN